MKLTTASLELPLGKLDAVFFDSELAGFGLRLRRGSNRVIRNWIVQYRANGHQRRMVIGSGDKLTAAQARGKAKTLLAEVQLGNDPQEDRKERRDRDEVTLRSVIKDYLAQKDGVKEATLRMAKHYLQGPVGQRAKKRGIKPYLATLQGIPIDRIERKDVAARLLAVSKDHGVPTAIALRSALNSLFTWEMMMGLTEANPIVGAFKPKARAPRDRVLSDVELTTIWNALPDNDYGAVFKLLVCTGCRRGEIGGMRRSEFASDLSAWTLPKERSKTGQPHTLPVTPLMKEILDSIPPHDGFDLLFGRKHGFTGWSIGKTELDEQLGLPGWTHHDIRRSVATGLGNIGVAPHIVEVVLNHAGGFRRGVGGTYNRSAYANEVRAAMMMWSDHVRSLVRGGGRKIVPMRNVS